MSRAFESDKDAVGWGGGGWGGSSLFGLDGYVPLNRVWVIVLTLPGIQTVGMGKKSEPALYQFAPHSTI